MAPVRLCAECRGRGRVIDSRPVEGTIKRRIECPQGHRWTTIEVRPEVKAGKRIKPISRLRHMTGFL